MRSRNGRRSSASRRSRTTAVSAYGTSASSWATASSVARHSASRKGTTWSPREVSVTRRVRASGPASVVTRPSVRNALTVWLIAECVTPVSAASSLMVRGPR